MQFAEAPVGSDLAKEAVRAELERVLGVAARRIIVKLDGTRVILHGFADSVERRFTAEMAVRHVAGVSAVSNYIHASLPH
ncbi:MAG TPA: BON domain-containing protein [Bryobacteraceae bacterium]|nr:BON domain-containing protein [Bryobacteraceae bacterium]